MQHRHPSHRPGVRVATDRRFVVAASGALVLAAGLWCATADAADQSARARYQKERAACLSGNTHQDRATCLREAGAALNEARHGRLADTGSDYERNRLARCERVSADDRYDCEQRMRGQGIVTGAVEDGGLYREFRRTVPAQ